MLALQGACHWRTRNNIPWSFSLRKKGANWLKWKRHMIFLLKRKYDAFAWSHKHAMNISRSCIPPINNWPNGKTSATKTWEICSEMEWNASSRFDSFRMFNTLNWTLMLLWCEKKWPVCIDYTNLNKACPKDPFPCQKLINYWMLPLPTKGFPFWMHTAETTNPDASKACGKNKLYHSKSSILLQTHAFSGWKTLVPAIKGLWPKSSMDCWGILWKLTLMIW